MPRQFLAFDSDTEPRLELKWGSYMRDFRVLLDEKEIGRIDGGMRELKEGRDFQLPDNSTLTIKLHQWMMMDELQVLRNGQPLPGSGGHPRQKQTAAIRVAFFWGIVAIIGGALLMLSSSTLPRGLGFSPLSILFGLLMIGSAVTISQRSMVGAAAALIFYIADWAVGIYGLATVGGSITLVTTLAMLVRILIIPALVQGFGALKLLKRLEIGAAP